MAKHGQFDVEVVSEAEAQEELAELRSGRGGRVSKYKPLADRAQDLNEGEVMKVRLEKNEVGGLRGYLRRRFEDKYTVKSSKVDDDEYMAFVSLTPEEERE